MVEKKIICITLKKDKKNDLSKWKITLYKKLELQYLAS